MNTAFAQKPADLVLNALNDSRYEWRTVNGLSKATNLPYEQVEQVLRSLENIIVRSASVDPRGRSLYTTRDRYEARSTLWSRMRDALSGRIAS